MSRRRAGDALDAVRPGHDLADLLRRDVARDALRSAEVAADPVRAVDALRNDDAFLVDDAHDAAGGEPLDPERVLEVREPGADGQNSAHAAVVILDRSRDRDDPFAKRAGEDHVADRRTLAGQRLQEVFAIAGVEAPGRRGRSDVETIERKQRDITDVAGQFGLHPAQQRVIRGHVGRIGGHRPGEADEQVLEIADVVVDLRRKQPGFVAGALDGRGVVVLPLVPKSDPDQGREWDNGSEHQAEQLRSNAAKQHQPAPLS
jgi:hypothetical protein